MAGLTEREHEIAEQAARKVLAEFFPALGLTSEAPAADLRKLLAARALLDDPDFAEDIAFIRRLRGTTEAVAAQGIKTFVSVCVTAFLGIVLLGTKDWWLKHIVG
jgi:hypothetical protein